MAREFAKAFYNSKQWKECRRAYIAQRMAADGGMCETCHEVPEITLNFSNLKYDCHVCHQKENKGEMEGVHFVQYGFTEEGEVYVLPPV